MDKKDLELYLEENRQAQIDLQANLDRVAELITKQIDNYVAPSKEITGEVSVSNLDNKDVVAELEQVKSSVTELKETLATAIKDNAHKPLDSVSIKNITDAKTDTVKISNLQDLNSFFKDLEQTIIDNQSIVNVTKQTVEFSSAANKPIAVRLSDGKSFYNAITGAIGANKTPLVQSVTTPSVYGVPVVNPDGTNISGGGASATVYTIRIDEVDANITYIGDAAIGSTTNASVWRIKKMDTTSGTVITYADGNGNFDNVWNDRSIINYS